MMSSGSGGREDSHLSSRLDIPAKHCMLTLSCRSPPPHRFWQATRFNERDARYGGDTVQSTRLLSNIYTDIVMSLCLGIITVTSRPQQWSALDTTWIWKNNHAGPKAKKHN